MQNDTLVGGQHRYDTDDGYTDYADYSAHGYGIIVKQSDGGLVVSDGQNGRDTLYGIDVLKGTALADEIRGGSGLAEIYLGGGDDVLKSASTGSIVYGGSGSDTFGVGNSYLIADADADDRLTFAGQVLTGGIRWANSETPWATGVNGVQYAINEAGELGVKALNGGITFVAGFKNTLTGPYTAGIGIGELSLEFYRLLETPNGWGLFDTFEALMGYALKFLTGESYFGTVDPLVLDLDGDGIELAARSSVSPFFDVDGDGFAEQMRWVQGDDGFLVRDLNANGSIDDVGEMFGDGDTSGFAARAKAKQYNGYPWNAEGISVRERRKIARCGMVRQPNINGLFGENEAFLGVFAPKMHGFDAKFGVC